MKRTWSFYDVDGALTGRTFTGNEKHLELNTPAGFTPIEGRLDHMSQRVAVATGEVVDYQPPQPSPDHEWHAQSKRWELNAAKRAELQAVAEATAAIADCERLSGPRAVREALLAILPEGPERQRLAALDDQVKAARAVLTARNKP